MDTRRPIAESSTPISLSASFNQDASCFAIGLETGFCVFDTATCGLNTSRDFNAGIGNVEMLERTNYVTLTGGGRQPKFAQNKAILWDDGKQKIAVTFELRTSVLAVRFSRSKIVVVLQNSVHVYDFGSPPKKQFVFETTDNLSGLCCLGPKLVAFPGQTPGKVQLVELTTGNVSIIPAHDSPLRALGLSKNGEILATASEKGTLIRIFSTYNSTKIAELRRGVDPATIYSIQISPNNQFLAVTSDKSTLHVFDLPFVNQSDLSIASTNSGAAPTGVWGFLGKIPFMPRAFSDNYSFASATFNSNDDPSSTGVETGVIKPPEPIPGIPGGRAPKGIIGWLDDNTIVVIGAGRDGRWERFGISTGVDGKRFVARTAWKRILGN